ncbi:hypothetical protein DQ04_00391090 [Trypanosoma grayi]|uniref:hypothetical protein n=1 Tax=Trypanosoma grayi TaxID=71804 RepID=UPI0004F4114A|nr:hypothetical protein DQ04_00391090 [Trypanosoma grayi]KEG14587.1 hypothetical protein DQ04_00391090 [Trypanosoma grayi]
MSQTVRIRTEMPGPLPRCFTSNSTATATAASPFPGFVPGVSFDASAPSRRQALQQFHRFEMMTEVEERLRAESGLVLSDDEGVGLRDQHVKFSDAVVDSSSGGGGGDRFTGESAARAALHDAREELAGRTLHVDPYREEDLWLEAEREARLEGDEEEAARGGGAFFKHRHVPIGSNDALEENNHSALMDQLGNLQFRITQTRLRQQRRWRHTQSDASGEVVLSEEDEPEFDPDSYIAPLLRPEEMMGDDDLSLLLQPPTGGDADMNQQDDLHSILPDGVSVQEALRLLQYSIQSDRPDVAACVRKCQEDLQQRNHVTTLANIPVNKETNRGNKAEVPPRRVERPQPQPPSAAELAALVAKSLPPIPEELRDELTDQRRLLERLAAAQEESHRRLAREQQDASWRRLLAPRADPTALPLSSATLHGSEPYEVAEALQRLQKDSNQPLPPVITITTMRPQPPAPLRPSVPPPHYLQDELDRLHQQYKHILRDERRAWMNIIEKQKETLNREKNAAVETLRYTTAVQQRENAEEIKRVIVAQEHKRQRWQHAAEVKQQQAFQQMLYKAMPAGSTGVGAPIAAPARQHPSPTGSRHDVHPSPKKRRCFKRAGKNENEKSADAKREVSSKPRRPTQKGPYRVVLPKEEWESTRTKSRDGSLERVDEVVELSDNEMEKSPPLPFAETAGGARIFTTSRKITKASLTPTGKGIGAIRPPRRSPYAASAKRPASVRTTSKRPHAPSPHRGVKLQRRTSDTDRIGAATPYAFDVKGNRITATRRFESTAESVLAASSLPSEESVVPLITADGAQGRHEADAILLRSVVLLSDPLAPEEAARRRSLESAYDASRFVPPPASQDGDGLQRPCDMYYFGEERSAMTPHRRAKLLAAEAQTRIEARRRLERIKANSLSPKNQRLGEAAEEQQYDGEETERRLADLLANETIHCIIGEAAEETLFVDLMRELESELVRAELHRIASSDFMRRGGNEEHEEHQTGVQEVMQFERVTSRTGTRGGSVSEEMTLEETILRHLEESMLHALQDSLVENVKETAEEAVKVRSEDTTHRVTEVDARVEENPPWVREVVSATTDPLWRQSEEVKAPPEQPLLLLPPPSTTTTLVTPATGGSPPPTLEQPKSGILVAVEGAGSGSRILPGVCDTIRIVLDVAPVVEHIAATLPSQPPVTQPTRGASIASEDRRLLYAAEEDLRFCEVVDAPSIQGGSAAVGETVSTVTRHIIPSSGAPVASAGLPVGAFPPAVAAPNPVMPAVVVPLATAPVVEPQQHLEEEWRMLRSRCQDDETLRRETLEEQEETLRASWHMMWDWQRSNVAFLQHQQKQNQLQQQQVCQPSLPTETQFPNAVPHANVSEEVAQHDGNILPPAPSSMGIRDPITKFIFEWMHDYDETEGEDLGPKGFVGRLHEASHMAAWKAREADEAAAAGERTTTATTEVDEMNVRRRLLMDIDNTEFSSWLSSTHPSSAGEDGIPKFVTRASHTVPQVRRTYRHSDENPSSATTETTRYTSSPPWLTQVARSRGLSPPVACSTPMVRTTTSTTVTTSSTSRTWPTTSSSEKLHLSEVLQRRLHSLQQSVQQEPPQWTLEELRARVETLQADEQRASEEDARRWGFAAEQLQHTGPPVQSAPLPQHPQWW